MDFQGLSTQTVPYPVHTYFTIITTYSFRNHFGFVVYGLETCRKCLQNLSRCPRFGNAVAIAPSSTNKQTHVPRWAWVRDIFRGWIRNTVLKTTVRNENTRVREAVLHMGTKHVRAWSHTDRSGETLSRGKLDVIRRFGACMNGTFKMWIVRIEANVLLYFGTERNVPDKCESVFKPHARNKISVITPLRVSKQTHLSVSIITKLKLLTRSVKTRLQNQNDYGSLSFSHTRWVPN